MSSKPSACATRAPNDLQFTFDQLYTPLVERLYAAARCCVGVQDAHDVVQETLVSLWCQLKRQYDRPRDPRAYAHRTLHNVCCRHLKASFRDESVSLDEHWIDGDGDLLAEAIPAQVVQPWIQAALRETRELLEGAIEVLGIDQQEALRASRDGASIHELAARFKKGPESMSAWLYRTRRQLERELERRGVDLDYGRSRCADHGFERGAS